MGPRLHLSAFFDDFLRSCGSLKKVQKSRLTGKRAGAYTPRLIANGAGGNAGTDAADEAGREPVCPWMFDIVNGRETRAAVLLAGFAPDQGPSGSWVRKQPIDIDGLRLSMESQFKYDPT
jgi:hypothetical protein